MFCPPSFWEPFPINVFVYIPTVASCTNAHSNEAECEKWAAEGECQINSRWMPKNCQKSCHMCGKDVDKPTETPDTDDDQDGQYAATCKRR